MPRPARFIHPFRHVREIMGMSQERAAEALGISRSALQQIERGVLPLSDEISTRMLLVSGAAIPTGLCRETQVPVAWDNSPYNAKSLGKWTKKVFPQSKIGKLRRILSADLEKLLKAADRKGCLVPFMWAIQTALGDEARNFRVWDEEILGNAVLDRLFGNWLTRATASGMSLAQANALIMGQAVKARKISRSWEVVEDQPAGALKSAGSKKPPA